MKDLNTSLKILLDSINDILDYTDWYDLEDFIEDKKTFDACLMQFQHLWESTRKILEIFPSIDFLPREIIWLRNFIAHEYLWISEKVIFNTIKNDLPKLKDDIVKNLSSWNYKKYL